MLRIAALLFLACICAPLRAQVGPPPSGGGATIANTSNVLKGDGAGNGVAATPGTDYVVPAGNVATASALAATPTPCSAGSAPTGILANGNSTGCAAIGSGSSAYPVTITGGVSGGVPYGNDASHLTVSPAGGAGILMKWGGAGLPPTISAILDNGTTVTLTENLVINVAGNGFTGFGATTTIDTYLNRSAAGVIEFDGSTIGDKKGVAYAGRFRCVPFAITSSATPTIDMTNGSCQTLTFPAANVTSITVTNITSGDILSLQLCQDSVGSRTVAGATLLHGLGTVGTTASQCNMQEFKSFNGTTFVAMGTMVTNVAP